MRLAGFGFRLWRSDESGLGVRMKRQTAGPELERLVTLIAKLPGLGPRSARRVALFLLKKRDVLMIPLAEALMLAAEKVRPCGTCGNFDAIDPCAVCMDSGRDPGLICVVEDVADLWALERASAIRGRYHVLGGVLSALDGVRPQDLRIDSLVARATLPEMREIILAMNATIDGQTTALYLTERLAYLPVRITRLAQGVPVGGELDHLDEGTLLAALTSRREF